ncbi:MAG: hypothetical protein ABJ242_04705 [Marinomonas sp.]
MPASASTQTDNAFAKPSTAELTFADLAGLSDAADLVIRAQIRRQIRVKAERAPGLQAGFARLYIEARTLALVSGNVPIGESLRYLVDVPLTAKGKVPKLKRKEVLLFARAPSSARGNSAAGATQIQLVSPHAQQAYSPYIEERLRPILSEMAGPEAPARVTGVRDALSVSGNLAGESETQIFLKTDDGAPVSIAVLRRPSLEPVWGVSWGEIIDQSARPPRPQTVGWFRLACNLPPSLPSSANLSRDRTQRMQAERDYRFVMGALGTCERNLPQG